MYGAGKSTQIANLRKQQGSNLEDDDKAPETVTAPQESEDGTGYKSEGRQHYFYWKYINAYNLALINKYMGTKSDMDVADLQLSNQSVVFLLQSQLKETELRYYASNLNHSDSGKGKSSSKTPFIYNRFITPQKSDDIASMKISGFFITLAYTMILFTYVKTLATISITDYIVGRWKAMFAGLKGSWSNAIYYSILTWFWGLIVTFIPTTFQFGASIITEASKILSDSALGTAGGFGVGLGVLCVAWILTYPFVQVADKKISLVVGLVYMFDVVRLAIKGWLFGRYGLDSIIYQNSGFGAGALLGLATGGLLGAKQDLQQRIGGVKNSFGNGIDGLGASPTSDIDDSNPNNPYSPNGYDGTDKPDELVDENGNRRELTEEEKKRSPLRQGLEEERFDENGKPIKPEGIVDKGRGRTNVGEGKPTSPNGMPTTPNKRGNPATNGKGLPSVPTPKTKFDKAMSVVGKGAGIGLQVARSVTTASMSAIGMQGLTNHTNKAFDGVSKVGRGVGKAVAPQSPIRQAVAKNKDRLKDYVDNRRAKKPQPLGIGGKVPTVNEKPLTPKREGKIKPTIVNQEKPVETPVVKDVYSPTVPQITRKDTMKPIKKPLRFPKNKRNKTRK